MTTLEVPGVPAPDTWSFGFDDLDSVGVRFSPEQLHAYDQVRAGRRMMALTVGFPHDPEVTGGFVQPLFTLDHEGNEAPVVVPVVVELDGTRYDELLEHEGPNMDRFPSLPGRTLTPIVDTHGYGPDVDFGPMESHRLWMLWPLQSWEAEEVLDGMRLWRAANYDPLQAWYACGRGDIDPCDMVIETGGPSYDEHQHREHLNAHGDCLLIECADGEEWMESYREHHFRLDDDGSLRPLPLAPPELSDRLLHQLWEHLRDTSAMNSFRAITAFPSQDRPAILRTERHYSPWLWSS